jgi:predicted regulator of Ras-like GTPase activity (Roadblock/LC7/MglB family)
MTFMEILARVVDATPGALAGAIMGSDGIAVEDYVRPGARVDLPAVAVEFLAVLEGARKVARSLEADGALEELVLTSRAHTLFFRQVDDEYFLVLALEPSGMLGKARYLVRSLMDELRERL